MQRQEDGMIVIACDFTGVDWDERIPMIEGHRGSVLSLGALELAIAGATKMSEGFACTMCLREFEAGEKGWRHPDPPAAANGDAVICWDCVQQADRSFGKDPDTDWERKLAPTKRWR
ncbi:hypothetical protein [Mucisphaera sp.]|uniref:hypothetical protein n=1 Tax=Mucisphaera sp. TaxID=2913024 RepID=UPI003D0C12C3